MANSNNADKGEIRASAQQAPSSAKDNDNGDALQHVLTEMSTVAFVASIVMTIAFPSLIQPPDRLADMEGWSTVLPWQGSLLNFDRQFMYGFLWCASSTISILSVVLAFANIYALMIVNRKGHRALAASVEYLRTTPFSDITAGLMPAPLKRPVGRMVDVMIFLGTLGTSWRPSVLSVPVRICVGALVWLALATTFNMYFLVPSYFIAHLIFVGGGMILAVPTLAYIGRADFLKDIPALSAEPQPASDVPTDSLSADTNLVPDTVAVGTIHT